MTMDITPNVNLLRSLRGVRINYALLIGEAIDNAFDAGARRVEILLDDKEIEVHDDGVGITRDRIGALFSLGEHGGMTTTQLGRFGIGIKNHAVNAGDIFSIDSVSRDGRVCAVADWRHILTSGSWSVDDPQWAPVAVGTPTGTHVAIQRLRKPPEIKIDSLANDIAHRFYPAIAAGCCIVLAGHQVESLPEPQLTDIVEKSIGLSDGRSAHLRAGILVGDSKLRKVHVSYKHRVIMPASTVGCSGYGGLTRMFARVQLDGPWHLAQYKNDLPDEDERSELEESVGDALEPILEKCNSASLSARVEQLGDLINERISPEMAAARPKRQKDRGKGKPKRERKRQNGLVSPERSEPDGPARTARTPRDKLLITFDGLAEDDGLGAFQPGRPHRVNLSKDDPYVARLIEHRDQELAADSLFAMALAIFEQGRTETQPELQMFGSFGFRVARHLAIQSPHDYEATGS